jgi:hypothetical protein
MPGVKIPNFPFGGAMLTGLRIQFPPDSFEKCRAGFDRGFGARFAFRRRAGWNGAQHDAASGILLQTESKAR